MSQVGQMDGRGYRQGNRGQHTEPVDGTEAFTFREPLGYFEQKNEVI